MQNLKVALWGCGRVSQRHMEVFRDEIRDAEVTLVCDLVEERAKQRAADLKCRFVTDYREMLSSPDVDLVVILTESGNHGQHARLALDAGKHVVVEKPAALNADEVTALGALARERKLMYCVIFQNRFNPAIRALKQAYDWGRFGTLVLATVRVRWCRAQSYYEDGWHGTWAMDGGVINQQAIHHVDALQWICGMPEQVVSNHAQRVNKLEAEDTHVALARFPGGGMGVIEATTAARPRDFEASMSIVGDKGSVVVGGIALNKIEAWEFVEEFPDDENAISKHSREVPTGYGLSHGPFLQEVVDRIRAGVLVGPVSAEEGVQAIRLVHALYRSAETGAWVTLADAPQSSLLGRSPKAARKENSWTTSSPART